MIATLPSCQSPWKNVHVLVGALRPSLPAIDALLFFPAIFFAPDHGICHHHGDDDHHGIDIMTPPTFVFDAYGTLFDVHAAIGRHREAAGADADRFSDLWRSKQLEYTWTLTLAGHYLDFWTLTQRALDYAFARVPSVDKALRARLLDAYMALEAFPDARAILRALKARGLATAILSNGSSRMLAAAVEAAELDADLDAVLSIDAVRMYKPRPEVYRLVTDRFMIAPSDVVFVSSNRWDVMGGAAFGFRTVWINRAGMPDEYTDRAPIAVLSDLGSLITLAG
jgi:2-haloacid dehalogenase